ncbi:CheR family methyltransferase [Pseudomonas japonica]|uniref:CheR family methyltransferase n=1 Tax=Pseudomonas japonica TaxID=256466 RepID=UPI0015E3C6A2|nr:CheR family methyltransferase [Pseudomonas japonica]MBA1241639.1 PAS domain S-box protein [Pseudomonas japonica]
MAAESESTSEKTLRTKASGLPFPLVGIGASAGGLQAVKAFFSQMPKDPGMAFAVVLHLSPHHQSIADRIIQEATGMPVRQVTERVRIEPSHVYVIAPAQHLIMVDGCLDVLPSPPRRGGHVAIDLFFRDLAEAHQENAFCIVLSGAGSDGAVGLTRIKEEGGVTFAQTPEDAEYNGMPRAAIETGAVDFILPVVEMPEKLLSIWKNSQQIRLPPSTDADDQPVVKGESPDARADEHFIHDILIHLRAATGHDFRHYKRATILRRIERRLQVTAQPNLEAYYNFLLNHGEEAKSLLGDMLIGVTNFFRDREAFEALERDVLPGMIKASLEKDPPDELRVWSAGCSTGEEAYSLAMVITDMMETEGHGGKMQVFATDIDERAISIARGATYPEAIVTDVPPAQLRQYFLKEGERYRVRKEIRERILFANHSLLSDPPFSQIDLITCRNLLIYLSRDVQREILQTFHFALRPGGYLFLGTSESADSCPELFTPVDKKNRIFRARPVSGSLRRSAIMPRSAYVRANVMQASEEAPARRHLFKDVHRRAVEKYAPPSVIVDTSGEILHMTEGAGRYLRHIGGEPTRSLLLLILPSLRLELRTTLFQVQQSQQPVVSRAVRVSEAGEDRLIQIAIEPYRDDETDAEYTFIQFRHAEAVEDTLHLASADYAENTIIANLERELQRTKGQLQETIEHSEVSSEELKASNEEMQAVNEELRSATEELETSKEELQSINEELLTVNHELKMKVEETDKVNDYLTNLIASTDIATVFVDRGMRIKWFTPRATDIFSMIPVDTGRSLLDITHRLNYPNLAEDAEEVFRTLSVIEREVSSSDDHWYIARLLPYRSSENQIHGTVLTFIDITKRRAIEQQFRAGEERLRLVAESTRDYAIFILDENGVVTDWYRGAELMFGYARSEAEGRYFDFIYTPEDRAAGAPQAELAAARTEGRGEDERWHLRKDGSRMYCIGEVTLLQGESLQGFVKIAKDLTGQQRVSEEQRQMLQETQLSNQLKDEFFAVMSHELKHPLNLIQLNIDLLHRLAANENSATVRAIRTIREAVKGQARIIDDLLDVARVQTGKLNLDCKPLDLCHVLKDIHALAARSIEKRFVSIECTHERLIVNADITRLEQIIWNLISNALKFTDDHGSIKLVLSRDNNNARLQVIDDGIGIEPASQEKIFDLFGQAKGPRGWRERQGLGIGLSLVSQLASAFGGSVAVDSAGIGHGATFTVTLPLVEHEIGPAAEPTSNERASLAGLNVLLVDDSSEVLDVMRELIEMEEATVQAFSEPTAALEWARTAQAHVIISDLGMPGLSGYDLLKALRGLPAWESTVAIALSGYGEAHVPDTDAGVTFDHRLGKPVAFDQLLSLLSEIHQGQREET